MGAMYGRGNWNVRNPVAAIIAILIAGACGGGEDDADPRRDSSPRDATPGDIKSKRFSDPDGTYTITIDPEWVEISGSVVAEVEQWRVEPSNRGFATNVNVLTQRASGMSLESYLDLSVENMGGFHLIERDTITSDGGHVLGVLEYTGSPAGDRRLHFLATVDVRDGVAVVATLTVEEELFSQLRRKVEPYLLTLRSA